MDVTVKENIIVEGAPWRLNEFVADLTEGTSLLSTFVPPPAGLKGNALTEWKLANWGTLKPDTGLSIEASGLDYGAIQLTFTVGESANGHIVQRLRERFTGLAFSSYGD